MRRPHSPVHGIGRRCEECDGGSSLEAKYLLSFDDFSGYAYAHRPFTSQLVHNWNAVKGSEQDTIFEEELVEICIPFAEQVIAAVGQGRAFGYT